MTTPTDPQLLDDRYLDFTLRSVLILNKRFPSGHIDVDVLCDAVRTFASDIAARRAASDAAFVADQEAWLDQQFQNLTVSLEDIPK